ncbi:acetyltransferase [Actinoplanes sp. SE50]|uniref:GNAT family N-acetyltransferase n=1 Tax=unclassified Actinoplanes TaxID=2626549 RepID=UPI00023ECFEC|nr:MULTISPECIES: GNAT family N-acetyltransferase [unclassified Actinoplanes]AEV82709.1 GCN5-related N-acetyltransferase [Actinoplanes sp. SE50/110]ATO81105.1 acetyltransferase [Actinoplanes sp. SE50]SLL98512.1 acetyltransferase [Actinoplanes sp. SE50/110]
MARAESDHFDRLEQFYDALPRPWARTEEIGSLVLFVRDGEGWPYYARPRRGAPTPSAADLTAARARQRELGVPESFEWVHETTPDLLAVARSAGLEVLLAPLLSLDPQALVPDLPVPGATIRLLDPDDPDLAARLAASRAVARLAFAAPAYRTPAEVALVIDGAGGTERDAAAGLGVSEEQVRQTREMLAGGDYEMAVVESPAEGTLATGISQRVGDVAEIAGVATLPAARGRGYASQLTATLARNLLGRGVELVFLSAGDDDVARLYTRVGFRRIGTACIAEPAAAPL